MHVLRRTGRNDSEYLIARAIQCFVPGIPQIYYVGLLAGSNDLDLLRRTGVGRDINRRYYAMGELEQAVARPVVRSLLALLRIRNTHQAFGGAFHMVPSPPERLVLEWKNGTVFARLDVNLNQMSATVFCSGDGADVGDTAAWQVGTEARR